MRMRSANKAIDVDKSNRASSGRLKCRRLFPGGDSDFSPALSAKPLPWDIRKQNVFFPEGEEYKAGACGTYPLQGWVAMDTVRIPMVVRP